MYILQNISSFNNVMQISFCNYTIAMLLTEHHSMMCYFTAISCR